jgi:hypothetical protein
MMIVCVVQVDGCAKKDGVGIKNAAVLSVRRRWLVFEISVQCVTFVSDRFASYSVSIFRVCPSSCRVDG